MGAIPNKINIYFLICVSFLCFSLTACDSKPTTTIQAAKQVCNCLKKVKRTREPAQTILDCKRKDEANRKQFIAEKLKEYNEDLTACMTDEVLAIIIENKETLKELFSITN